jgi:DNA processing protein
MDTSKIYQVAINLLPGIGNMLARQLISYGGTAENVFTLNKKKLMQIPGIGNKIANSIQHHATLDAAEAIVLKCRQNNIQILHFTDSLYPERLKQLYDAPDILYFKGNTALSPAKIISIVGTRRVTSYGSYITEHIVQNLRKHHVTIVSGLAYGVDHIAHQEALNVGLPTIGVIAGGMHNIYPALHIKTARKMMEKGGIITEHEPDIIPEAHFFPERNRIIAGMADAVIVIETAKKGGALITAEFANNYNREVFAVPGQIAQTFSEGCNNLIKSHKANIFTSVADLEYILNWDPIAQDQSTINCDTTDLTIPEKKIVNILRQNMGGIIIDDLSWKSQIPVNQIASHLLNLEFRGFVQALPGKKFRLKN